MTITIEQFYRFFWSDDICQNVFLLHKELLLEKNSIELGFTDYYLQRIVLSNSLTSKDDVEERMVFRQENRFTAVLKKLAESKEKYLNEERFKDFVQKRFGQTIELAKRRYEEEGIWEFLTELYDRIQEEGGFLSVLKEYKVVPETISNLGEVVKYAELELTNETRNFLKNQNFSQMFLSIDDISQFYNSVLKESLINGYKQNVRVLIDKDNFKSRVKLFDRLYEIGVLTGGKFKSYFECINCLPDTFSGFITCNIQPSKIKLKCPQCSKDSNYLVPYFIIDELFEHIIHQDGLLFFAIQYLLDIYKIEYKANHGLDKLNEIDFVLTHGSKITGLIEVKMFRNDKSDEVKVKNIKETIGQIKKTKTKLAKNDRNYIGITTFLVTNIDRKELNNKAKNDLRDDLREFNIDVFTPNDFHEYIRENREK